MSEPILLSIETWSAWKWQPIVPLLHIYGGCAVLTAVALYAFVRVFPTNRISASLLLVMRLALIASIATVLMGPSRAIARPEQLRRSKLTILLDTSQSMLTNDCDNQSRIGYVTENVIDQEQLRRLAGEFDIEMLAFDTQVRPLYVKKLRTAPEAVAQGHATLLAESVKTAISQVGPKEGDAILVISDGRDSEDTSMQSVANLARSKKVPLYTVGVGGTGSTVDAALFAIPMQDYLLPDEPGGILVKIYHTGLQGLTANVRLKQGNMVDTYPILLGESGVTELQIPIQQPEDGQYQYDVSLDALDGETELANNEQVVFCEVMKRRIRVLILEGQPFWDSKFLAQSLRKDQHLELTQISQVSTEKRETIVSRVENRSSQLPDGEEEWANYDIVILGRGLEHILDDQSAEQLVAFVRKGGGHLIFSRGLPYDPESERGSRLSEIMSTVEPVVWGTGELQELSVELTPSGRSSLWMSPAKIGFDTGEALERLPGFEVMRIVDGEKPGTIVLARAFATTGPQDQGMPAIVSMAYGTGRVAALLGEGHWKWSLLTPENEDLRGFYDTLWSNLVRWMVIGGDFEPGQQVALNLSRATSRLGDPLTAEVFLKKAPAGGQEPSLEFVNPEGHVDQIALHRLPGAALRYRATLEPETAGIHDVHLNAPGMTPAELRKKLNVYDMNLERLLTDSNMLTLKIMAENSGGSFFLAENTEDLFSQLQHHRISMLTPPKLAYLWDRGWIMTILLIWIGMELFIRRWVGLW
ncbi:hypothetical protein Pan258_12660 [Symmachiella dynata]|uniref:hypothetical protein n=1 Tax=Symmachiella dynata TaxID=2527995 RepID=UPI00118AE5B4|nr:hypothetical protein [Symmachiella dynata]QDT47235.1 hypothetical protein Pan258_12660 [Symmachiella dynata]